MATKPSAINKMKSINKALPLEKKEKSSVAIIFLLIALLFLTAIACLCIGKYSVSIKECLSIILGLDSNASPMTQKVILHLRLPRVISAIVVGASLSLSGAIYQGVFQNPLVSPDFLGVSSGACIGAAVGILLSLPAGYIQFLAFLGGILAVSITLFIPKLIRSDSNLILVLSGIIVGGLMGSIMGIIKYYADPTTKLADITYWQMGSLSYISIKTLLSVLFPIIASTLIMLFMAWWLDILSLGETDARSLGANVKRIRLISIACSTLLTASSVCIAGTIGWIGLVIPHFSRMIVGPDNRRLLPTSCIVGALFLLACDTLTRSVGQAELPISILTGVIGAPFYAWVLYKQRGRIR